MGKLTNQINFSDTDGWYELIPQNSFLYKKREWADENLSDNNFAHLYSTNRGRKSAPPVFMLKAILIQLEKKYLDRAMEEAAMFDDRVKYALCLSST